MCLRTASRPHRKFRVYAPFEVREERGCSRGGCAQRGPCHELATGYREVCASRASSGTGGTTTTTSGSQAIKALANRAPGFAAPGRESPTMQSLLDCSILFGSFSIRSLRQPLDRARKSSALVLRTNAHVTNKANSLPPPPPPYLAGGTVPLLRSSRSRDTSPNHHAPVAVVEIYFAISQLSTADDRSPNYYPRGIEEKQQKYG